MSDPATASTPAPVGVQVPGLVYLDWNIVVLLTEGKLPRIDTELMALRDVGFRVVYANEHTLEAATGVRNDDDLGRRRKQIETLGGLANGARIDVSADAGSFVRPGDIESEFEARLVQRSPTSGLQQLVGDAVAHGVSDVAVLVSGLPDGDHRAYGEQVLDALRSAPLGNPVDLDDIGAWVDTVGRSLRRINVQWAAPQITEAKRLEELPVDEGVHELDRLVRGSHELGLVEMCERMAAEAVGPPVPVDALGIGMLGEFGYFRDKSRKSWLGIGVDGGHGRNALQCGLFLTADRSLARRTTAWKILTRGLRVPPLVVTVDPTDDSDAAALLGVIRSDCRRL